MKAKARILSLVLCAMMLVTLFASCVTPSDSSAPPSSDGSPPPSGESAPPEDADWYDLLNSVSDSSELPDWTGKNLKLNFWYGHGTGGAERNSAPNDVVSPEIKRILGIEMDAANSFDNSGSDLATTITLRAASNDWPALGYGVITDDLLAGDKIYDLTELLPIYCPNIWEMYTRVSPGALKNGWTGTVGTGRHWGVPVVYRNDVETMLEIYPDLDLQKYQYIASPEEAQGQLTALWVRDDILKLAYPQAKTQDEIEAMYMEKGFFTREDVYDVPITSKEGAVEFFYNIAQTITDNNITESGRPVYATSVFQGQDNWALMAWLNNMLEGIPGFTYFTYFDSASDSIKMSFLEDWLKEDLRLYNNFIRDGVAPEACLIENNEIYMNKQNNGEYAITYAWNEPDHSALAAAGKPYRYRKVYLDIPQNTSLTVPTRNEAKPLDNIAIFKDKVSEEDLPQVLMFLDFLASEVGMNLLAWGPQSAGLWEVQNGQRIFTNEDLEAEIVYGESTGATKRYNLLNPTTVYDGRTPAWPQFYPGVYSAGIYSPRYSYDMLTAERKPSQANPFFSSGLFGQVKKLETAVSISVDIWNFTENVPGMNQFWEVRGTGFEPLMTKCFAAQDDAAFEVAYNNMVTFARENGITDEAIRQCQEYLEQNFPEDWASYLAG